MNLIKVFGLNEKDVDSLNKNLDKDLGSKIQYIDNIKNFNNFEWFGGAFIVVYIVKPLFDSYLKELGKDFYESTKKLIKKIHYLQSKKTAKRKNNNVLLTIVIGIYDVSFIINSDHVDNINELISQANEIVKNIEKTNFDDFNESMIIRKTYEFDILTHDWFEIKK